MKVLKLFPGIILSAVEVYRSGHNGPDSKSGIRQRIVGSNPTASANKPPPEYRVEVYF